MSHLQNKVVAITGASAGIGRATALALSRHGAIVSLAARRLHRLQEIAEILEKEGRQFLIEKVDVTKPGEIQAWLKNTGETFGHIDVLVNNAGAGCVGGLADIDPQLLRDVMELNFFAPLNCIQAVVPWMRKQGDGHIINISSIIGKRSIPEIGGYCATKFALNAATDALRLELKSSGIAVTNVCPGQTATEFADQQMRETGVEPMRAKFKGQAAEDVAQAILRAVLTRPREIQLTASGKVLVWLEKLSPSLVDMALGFRHHFYGSTEKKTGVPS